MKILVLTSGGDAPGMNMILYSLYRKFGKNLFAARAGFKGLINNDICNISEFKMDKLSAGSIIKSSRCPDFKTREGFKKGLNNAKNFDYVIILGGNGSYKGACELAENGIKAIFIPATIDNDVEISEYSQGFNTAVSACINHFNSIMPSMETFNRCCIFQVMGRECDKIAKDVFAKVNADYLITSSKDIEYDKIAQKINERFTKGQGSSIIIKENIIKLDELIKNLSIKTQTIDIKGCEIGYVQRGTAPTKFDLNIAKCFAHKAINAISKNIFCSAIVFKAGEFQILEKTF